MLLVLIAQAAQVLKLFGLAKIFIELVTKNEKFFVLDRTYNLLKGTSSNRLVLELPGRGCSWFKKSSGCTMCGFNRKLEAINQEWRLSARDLTALYKIADLLTGSGRPELLCVFNGGSFFNEDEIPLKTQLSIARKVGKHPTLSCLFVESRPEFITAERVSRVCDALNGKKLEVGIGLEAVTDKVREDYIHKGFNLSDYERAVRLLRGLGIYVLTYVFLKPLHLSEREAVEEAVRTTEYAFHSGSAEVSLSCAFIQEGTQMAAAYVDGKFNPPWLWSIIEVVRRTAHLGPVRIGSFNDNPPPIDIPHNCPKCSKGVEKVLQKYNLTRDISIFTSVSCECQKEWQREIEKA